MTCRPLKELYQILLDYINENGTNGGGICLVINMIHGGYNLVSFDESKYLHEDLYSRRNDIPITFKENKSFVNSFYWWTCDAQGNEQRILFIKYIISTL